MAATAIKNMMSTITDPDADPMDKMFAILSGIMAIIPAVKMMGSGL